MPCTSNEAGTRRTSRRGVGRSHRRVVLALHDPQQLLHEGVHDNTIHIETIVHFDNGTIRDIGGKCIRDGGIGRRNGDSTVSEIGMILESDACRGGGYDQRPDIGRVSLFIASTPLAWLAPGDSYHF